MNRLSLAMVFAVSSGAFWSWWTHRWIVAVVAFPMIGVHAWFRTRSLEAWYYECLRAVVIGGFFAALLTRTP